MLNAHTHTVLLIEDDLVDIRTVKEAVSQLQNTSLVIAQHEREAIFYLKKCEEHLPSIIFLDIDMPSNQGMEFLKIIKANRRYRTIPIVLLTASKENQVQYTFSNSNVAGYILKSIDTEGLKELINILNSCWKVSEAL